MRNRLLLPVLAIATSLSAKAATPPDTSARGTAISPKIEANTRLQIFLDNANFGPGKIDGQQGEFTRKALALYLQSKGLPDHSSPNPQGPLDTTGLDLSSVNPVFIDYTVTADDAANVGEFPSGVEAKAKMKRLPYATLGEAVAEKFHCALAFLKVLNPGRLEKLKIGDQIKVPHVTPFILAEVKGLQPGSAPPQAANDVDGPSTASDSSAETPPKISVTVSVKEKMLEVFDDHKIAAVFPVTVGSKQTSSPLGHWTVKAIARLPNFRWDLQMLNKGERSAHAHLLPPGPNNPVGVIWIALNKKGIGIHGTDDPDDIGRNASHGCIRLANWDITKLAGMLSPGTPVTVE